MSRTIVYIGAYTGGGPGGIRTFEMDPETGGLIDAAPVVAAPDPSYLVLSGTGRFLYAALETERFEGVSGGGVAAYSIDGVTGALTRINAQPTLGRGPCHVSIDDDNRRLFVSNYNEGTFSVFALNADGGVGPLVTTLRHAGCGPVQARQEGPHAHYAALTPDRRYLSAVDLGTDSIYLHPYGAHSGVSPEPRLTAKLTPGAGPRHIAFQPSGRYAYAVMELSSQVVAFRYDADAGFTELQRLSTLPKGFTGANWCAAIRVSPDGRTLYASNREHDSIAMFRIDGTGMLTPAGHVPTGGRWPRDINLTPDGRFLYAACEKSDRVTAFAIDPDTGALRELGVMAEMKTPTCVVFKQI